MAHSRRQPVKSKHRADWQGQIRDECLQRVHNQRQKLLQNCRSSTVQECLQTVLSDVSEDLQPDGKFQRLSIANQSKRKGASLLGHQLLSVNEHQELMAQMEAALFDESYIEELEAIEEAEADDIADMFSKHCIVESQTESRLPDVPCPVCGRANLVESAFGFVSCPHEGFSIKAPMQGVHNMLQLTLENISARLQQHSDSCSHKPQFFVKTIDTCNLYMACYECGALDVVI